MSYISRVKLVSVPVKQCYQEGWIALSYSVRYRYHKDKIERGPLHRLGYEDQVLTRGLLPRDEKFEPVPSKNFCPPNPWSPEKALEGKNDYIDILGDSQLRPTDVKYEVPHWLRGFRGNEYQMLLRKRGYFGQRMREFEPCDFSDMERRIRYLYFFLNRKKKDYFCEKSKH